MGYDFGLRKATTVLGEAAPPATPGVVPKTFRQRLLEMLEDEEALRLFVYDDATGKRILPGTLVKGHPTIGIGRCLDTNGISETEARALLAADVDGILAALPGRIAGWDRLSDNRRMVLAGMAFQMGLPGLLKFTTTLALIERGDYAGAATQMLQSAWAKQTPDRAQRMADLMRRG